MNEWANEWKEQGWDINGAAILEREREGERKKKTHLETPSRRIPQHPRNNVPLLQRLQIRFIRRARPRASECIHVRRYTSSSAIPTQYNATHATLRTQF